jgi:hypothetical protein
LHVLEEILDALEPIDDPEEDVSVEVEDEVIATISQATSQDNIRRTMRLCGSIGKLTVLILVDSGSVGSFISDRLATHLQMAIVSCTPVQLMAADGSPMVCDQKIPSLQWSVQGHTFFS